MVSTCIIWLRTKKSDRIGRIVRSTQFFLCGQKFFCPPPYYAVWKNPHNNIVSFSNCHKVKNLKNLFYQSMYWSRGFFCMYGTTWAIQFGWFFLKIFWKFCVNLLINHFYQKITFPKIQFDDQHCDTNEYRAKFGIYVGNQKHPKLSTRTYGFSHAFKYRAFIEISWVKRMMNLTFPFWLDQKKGIF